MHIYLIYDMYIYLNYVCPFFLRVAVGASPSPKRTMAQKVVRGQPNADKIGPLWLSLCGGPLEVPLGLEKNLSFARCVR